MKTTRLFMYLFMAFAMIAVSCEGEDGMDGVDGIDGAQGPAGPAGQDGQDGNANVISSGWIEYETANWSDLVTNFGIDQRHYVVASTDVTAEVANDGVILMYTRFVITGTPAYMHPFVENITGGGSGQELSHQVEEGEITIRMMNVSQSGDPGTFGGPGIAEYRYVIIPAAPETRQAQDRQIATVEYYASLGVDLNDFEVVAEYFNIEE